MKRHLTASAVRLGTRNVRGAPAPVSSQPRSPNHNDNHHINGAATSGKPLGLPDGAARMHTLVLTGELDRRSAHALEAEIERLCEDGVAGITLDLRELTYIDSI